MSVRVEFHDRVEWHDGFGQYHRDDGPAIEWPDGTIFWCVNGQLHRDDGPAIEYVSGHREWWENGQLHRDDGPAIEYADGSLECWLRGRMVAAHEVGRWRFLDVEEETICLTNPSKIPY